MTRQVKSFGSKPVGTGKRSKPGKPGKTKSQHSDPEYLDEVDQFHSKKDQIRLTDQAEESNDDPETLLDIPTLSDDAGDFDEDSEWNKKDGDDAELFEKEEETGEDQDHDWGRGRKNYYSADAEDKENGEVAEADRLYRKKLGGLGSKDFGINQGKTLERPEVAIKSVTFSEDEDEESTGTSTDAQDQEQEELQNALNEVKTVLEPLMSRIEKGELPRSEGLSFLQTKYSLLLHYCINAVYCSKLKASGKPIAEDHPVLERLIKYRMLIEKLKPLEAKLKYQIDRLLKASTDPETFEEEYKPHTDLIRAGAEEGAGDQDPSTTYKPPKIMSTEMDRKPSKSSRIQSDLMKERQLMDSELPSEEENDPVLRNKSKSRLSGIDTIDAAEEDNFVRFSLSKKEKRKLEEEGKVIDGLDDLNDMFDEFEKTSKRGKFAVDSEEEFTGLGVAKKTKKPSAKKEKVNSSESEIEDDEDISEYYENAKKSKATRDTSMAVKKVQFRDIVDTDPSKPRKASTKILKNRGLTPSRPKDAKNPRVKQRKRFEKASKRLGSFRAVGREQARAYSGEATGIRTNVSKSLKF